MIKNPVILWAIFVFQILFFANSMFGFVRIIQLGHFSPFLVIGYVFSLVLMWVTLSHIKLLAKSQPTNADLFS